MHIRSLITGKPFLDLYGESYVYSSAGYTTTINYIQKGWFTGDYFDIDGTIKDKEGHTQLTISGKWTEEFNFNDKNGNSVFSFNPEVSHMAKRIVAPLESQGDNESQKLWNEVSKAIENQDYSLATTKKSEIENNQRVLRKERQDKNINWEPTFFKFVKGGPELTRVSAAIGHHHTSSVDEGSWVFIKQDS